MNTRVTPAAGQAGADANDVDLKSGAPLATRAMAGDIEAANELAFTPKILADWLKRELQGQDGLTDEERARLEQEEKREREDALVRMLEEDRERNNAIIADLRAKDADLCQQMQQMDKNAIVMPDGRLAYKDKYGNFVYLDGTMADDQDYARKKDAANGGKTQGWEERRAAEDTHIKYNKEIDQAVGRNAEIDRIEQKLKSGNLDESERQALQVHEETVKAQIAKKTVLDGTAEDASNAANLSAAIVDPSHDDIMAHMKHRTSANHAEAQPVAGTDQKMVNVNGESIYQDKEGNFVRTDGTNLSTDDNVLTARIDGSAEAPTASASRTSYSGGLETSANISSKVAFTLASAGVSPTNTPDGPTSAGNALQKNISPSPTAAV